MFWKGFDSYWRVGLSTSIVLLVLPVWLMCTEKLVRTTITLPYTLKEKMDRSGENWSQVIREMISQRIEEGGQSDMAEAVILNEKVKRLAPKNWSSLQVIKQWRRRTST